MNDGAGEAVVAAEALARIDGDRRRQRIVARLMRRLRRNERPPGILRCAPWRLERACGIGDAGG